MEAAINPGLRSLLEEPRSSSSGGAPFTGSSLSADQSRVLVRTTRSGMVSLWTCSKLCAVGFVLGIIVGFTLKQRLRRWAARVLRRLKDD